MYVWYIYIYIYIAREIEKVETKETRAHCLLRFVQNVSSVTHVLTTGDVPPTLCATARSTITLLRENSLCRTPRSTLTRVGSRRDVANRRQHRSGCASIPSPDCGPRSHQSFAVSLSLALTYTESERLSHVVSSRRTTGIRLSRFLSAPSVGLFLSHRSRLQSRCLSLSHSLSRLLPRISVSSHSIATFSVSLPHTLAFSLPTRRCPSLSLLIASMYLLCIYLPFFFLSHSLFLCLSLVPRLLVSVVLTGREIRSNTRDDVTSTPCAVCRRGARSDSTVRFLSPRLFSSSYRTQKRTTTLCLFARRST